MLGIGQFSKVCQVSVKALRHYDKIGLARPRFVDEWTGYRYYDETQIPTMLLISRLKRYGFCLSEIKLFLETDEKEQSIKRLRAQKAVLAGRIESTERTIREMEAHLKHYERTGNIMGYQDTYQIEMETAQDRPILSLREKMAVEDFGKYYGRLYEKAARERIRTNGETLAIYHDEAFDPLCSDIELALGVNNPAEGTRTLSGGTVATTLHKGAYSSLSDAYGALVRWIADNGYETVNAPYELYLKTAHDHLPPEQWETKIFFPVKKR